MSIGFYRMHAGEYFSQTAKVDPESFIAPLLGYIEPGSRILDVGCGSGRDLLWLKNRGFSCTGLEISPELAALAREHSGRSVIEADFEKFDFSRIKVDGVLLIGALVHVPHERFMQVFSGIIKALKPGGLALLSLKRGQGIRETEDGRKFYLWKREELLTNFRELGLSCIDSFVQSSKIRESDIWMSFILKKKIC
ncbi:MAG: class I SAM-dependent methyltransferase [Desulfonatronovibrionaceae bacterium]